MLSEVVMLIEREEDEERRVLDERSAGVKDSFTQMKGNCELPLTEEKCK